MDKSTHEIRLAQWKQIIEECQNRPEGQSAKQWLNENQIKKDAYYYWQRKIRQNIYKQLNGNNTLPSVKVKKNDPISFTEISLESLVTAENNAESFKPAALIKTKRVTIALSDNISDRLLNRILEVTHA